MTRRDGQPTRQAERWVPPFAVIDAETGEIVRRPASADPRKRRRSRQFPDIPDRYRAAVTALRERGQRLTKVAIATEIGIDRGTLHDYIEDYELPFPPP